MKTTCWEQKGRQKLHFTIFAYTYIHKLTFVSFFLFKESFPYFLSDLVCYTSLSILILTNLSLPSTVFSVNFTVTTPRGFFSWKAILKKFSFQQIFNFYCINFIMSPHYRIFHKADNISKYFTRHIMHHYHGEFIIMLGREWQN